MDKDTRNAHGDEHINHEDTVLFSPGYEYFSCGYRLKFPEKLFLCLGLGISYIVFLMFCLGENKQRFYYDKGWALAAIMGVALFCLYVATDTFKHILPRMSQAQSANFDLKDAVESWLSDRVFLLSAIFFACLNLMMGYHFGIQTKYAGNFLAQYALYFGFFMAGFICGLAAGGIFGLCMIFNRYALAFRQEIDHHHPDGGGGSQYIGNALMVFGGVTMVVGVLITIYIRGFPWDHAETNKWVELTIHLWVVFPYIMAFIVVSVPTMAISSQLAAYKQQTYSTWLKKVTELRSGKQKALEDGLAGTQAFEAIQKRLEEAENELAILSKMSVSPMNRQTVFNAGIAMIPNVLGTMSTIDVIFQANPSS